MGVSMWVHVWQQVLIRGNSNLYCASKLTELPAQSLAPTAQDLIGLRKEVSEHKKAQIWDRSTRSPRETTQSSALS